MLNAGIHITHWIDGGGTTLVGVLEKAALQDISAGSMPQKTNTVLPFHALFD